MNNQKVTREKFKAIAGESEFNCEVEGTKEEIEDFKKTMMTKKKEVIKK